MTSKVDRDEFELFDLALVPYTRKGSSIVPPTREELAKAATERAIERAGTHVSPEWLAKALGYVKLHATVHRHFACEEVREMAELDGFEIPAERRAWGTVMRNAARAGVIVADGHTRARSPTVHCMHVTRWRSLLFEPGGSG